MMASYLLPITGSSPMMPTGGRTLLSVRVYPSDAILSRMLLLLALLIGIAAGLRSMAPLAVVAWAAQSWPAVASSSLGFMAAPAAAYILTALAVGELIADKLPFIPSRLKPGPLSGRILSGALSAAVLCAAAQQPLIVGAIVGAVGGVIGSFAGHAVRRNLSVTRRLPDLPVALVEDLVTIALAVLVVSRV
jgi:uncharacterized membrane protein